VSIAPKGAESSGSGRLKVIGALVYFFPSKAVRTNSALSRHGSELRHREVADCPEAADNVDANTCPQKTADIGLGQSSYMHEVFLAHEF